MELLQLRYFLALAENENLTKTAQQLMISTSSLSLTISRLERELGVQLFNRVGRKLVINENGKVFLRHVQNSLGELDMAVAKLRKENSISIITDAPGMWSMTLSDYIRGHQNIYVNNRVMKRSEIKPEYLRNEYDFWLAGSDAEVKDTDLIKRQLTSSTFLLAVHDESLWAKKKSVRLEDLKDEKFIFPTEGFQFHSLYMKACLDAGFEPTIVATGGFLMRMQMIAMGNGIGFVDEMSCNNDLFKHIAFVELEDAPPLHSLLVFRHKNRSLSPVAEEFFRFICTYFQDR